MNEQLLNLKVNDRKSFIKFLDILREDLLKHPETWENNKLENFLQALSSYSKDIQGYYDNTNQSINADEPNWQTFADILNGARIYE